MITRLMNKLSFIVLFLASSMSIFLSQNNACADEFKATNVDATNINLVNTHKIENGGYAQRFSPNGKQILYSKDIKNQQGMFANAAWHALWVMDVDGKNKKKLFGNGDRGAWSPDGKRIAYCDYSTPSDGFYIQPFIFIYDIKTKKKYKIAQVDLDYCADNATTTWSTDAEEILLYKNNGRRTIIELGTLNVIKEENVDVEVIDSRMGKYSFVKFPNVSLYVIFPDLYHGINDADGLWAVSNDQSFERPLMKGVRSFDVAPDLKKIVFSSDTGIYVANVGVLKNLPPRTFHVKIGKNDLLAETRIGSTSIQEREKEVANGNVFGSIYRPKINPLNNRVIGPDGLPKAFARLTNVSRTHATVNVISEVYPVAKGDVISDVYVVGQGDKFAQSYWRFLEPASTAEINKVTTTEDETAGEESITTPRDEATENEHIKKTSETIASKEFLYQSPDGYQILIPKGFIYTISNGVLSLVATNKSQSITMMLMKLQATQDVDSLVKNLVQNGVKANPPVKYVFQEKGKAPDLRRGYAETTKDKVGILIAIQGKTMYKLDISTPINNFELVEAEIEKVLGSFKML